MQNPAPMRESAAPRGHVRVYGVNDDGSEVLLSDNHNQITYLHLTQLAQLITQRSTLQVAELAMNKVIVEGSVTPLAAPAPTDTGIVGTNIFEHVFDRDADVTINLGGVEGLVQFRAEMGKLDAVGETLAAISMFTVDDGNTGGTPLLAARQVLTPIVKTDALAIRFEWDIQYTIVL
jgi:hypothetical protein